MSQQTNLNQEIIHVKELRVALDGVLQDVKASAPSLERSLVVTKIQEAIMWLGMDLKRLGSLKPAAKAPGSRELAEAAYLRYGSVTDFKNFRGDPMPEFSALPETIVRAWEAAVGSAGLPTDTRPYPNSYDVTNTKVDPTADGLKL